jgi:hypothetical protein
MIISISGKAQSGKDTAGQIFQNLMSGGIYQDDTWYFSSNCNFTPRNFRIKKFAESLKNSIEAKFPAHFKTRIWEAGDSTYRDGIIEMLGISRRQLLIKEAMAIRDNVHPDYWLMLLMQHYELKTVKWDSEGNSLMERYPDWIITDMRFVNEFQYIEKMGGVTVRISRGKQPKGGVSEKELDDADFDWWIDNSGTYQDLVRQIMTIVKHTKEKN